MRKKITFIPIYDNILEIANPKPASLCIPDWYKQQNSYKNEKKRVEEDGTTVATIKKCIPIFDLITSGYIFSSSIDIHISFNDKNSSFFTWPSSFKNNDLVSNPIQFHPNWQISNYPKLKNMSDIPKFINPWAIHTPTGYSVLVMTPMHRELPFEILPGIVDTDKYNSGINFPFYLKDIKWEGIIPAGTPIAQIIPFKRDSWEMEINNDLNILNKSNNIIRSMFYEAYKNNFWYKKSFK
jgi:hypothetical protein